MKAATFVLAVSVGVWAGVPAGCGSDGGTRRVEAGSWVADARAETASDPPRLDAGAPEDGPARVEVGAAKDARARDAGLYGGGDTALQDRPDLPPEAAAADAKAPSLDVQERETGRADAVEGPADVTSGDAAFPGHDAAGPVDGAASEVGGSERIWVYLLAGQSNMMGFGTCRDLAPEDATAVPGVSIYYSDPDGWNRQAGQWLPLAPGFGASTDYFGPELTFARRMRELHPRRRLAFVKVAAGGTALFDRWKAPTGDLYQLLLREARTQLGVLSAHGRPQLAGLLWMQGESDGAAADRAEAYRANLTDLLVGLRRELGSDLLPVVAGLIATDYAGRFPEQVRTAAREVAAQLGRTEVVETDDLGMIPDENVHYDTDGYLRLGRRFAEAMETMQGTRWRFPEDFTGVQGEACFRYRDRTSADVVPLAYDEASQRWSASSSGIAIGSGFMVPDAGHAAELAFWAPFAGDIQVTFRTALPSPKSAGVTFQVEGPAVALAGPGGRTNWLSFRVAAGQGDEIRFRTSPGLAPDPDHDRTDWQIDIAMTNVDE